MGALLLEARGLSRHFGAIRAVDDVDLDLAEGECLGLIGPNGAGKSSLLAILAGSLRPARGTLVLEGRDVTQLPIHARVAAGIARASQIPQTFPRLTVAENARVAALFGARLSAREADAWVAEVLNLCQLADKADSLSASLGLLDRKRLELAKAVAARPKILLLDEIAAGLTEPEIETIMDLVRALKPGRAIVWVEHIPYALEGVCDRLLVMDAGAKRLEGGFREIWGSSHLQEIYMGMPSDVIAES